MNILFEDNHLIAVFKPAGIPTQKTAGHKTSLEEDVKAFVKTRDKKPGEVYLHAIHRLDKGVSGIVLFAKTSKALQRLNEEMREGKIEKIYTARLEKEPPEKQGTLRHFLKHDSFKSLVSAVAKTDYKEAVLHYKTIAPLTVEIRLETGRYHQIRAQFSAIGCPIAGDEKYGAKTGVIKLIHNRLRFTHPTTKELILVQIPLEEGFS